MAPNPLENKCMALVLAAGKGTRMRSNTPKVLHTLLGEPMLGYVLDALKPLFAQNILVVAGHQAQKLIEAFPAASFVIQKEQLGTGHALMAAMSRLESSNMEYAAIVNGDTPLITTEAMSSFLERASGADIAFAAIRLENAGSYGRVSRSNGRVTAIVEAKDFDPDIHGQETGEINAGIYLLRINAVKRLLPLIRNNNKSGEYYITDLVALGAESNLKVEAIDCGDDPALMGVNSPLELSAMEELLRDSVTSALLESGVIIHAPQLARVSPRCVVEPGAELTGPCEISGQSVIRRGAIIESHCIIRDSLVCENAIVRSFSHLDHASVGVGAKAGPFARLRPGAILEQNSQAGNFVELKKARLAEGAKANHLSYLGDAEIGAHANIGAGTITCNFDGKNKFRTEIGENAFIGSNSALVAPVKIGNSALVGAGSVITKDVPDEEMAIARGKQKNMPRKSK